METTDNRWRLSSKHTATMILLFALGGLLMSVFVTFAKFRSAYHCDESMLSACAIGGFLSCDQVLASSWSAVGWSGGDDYPITLFATSFYGVLMALSASLLIRRSQATSSSLLLYLAWGGVLTCLPLAGYAYLVVGGVCLYCTCLYLVNISLLLAVMLLDRRGQRRQLADLWRPRPQISMMVMVALFFVAATLVQMLFYGKAIREVGTEPRCITEVGDLPSSPLLIGPAEASTVTEELGLFVDLSCEHCAATFETWAAVVRHSDGRLRLRLYPLAGDNECDVELQFRSPAATQHNTCTATRAVECVEELAPGRGIDLAQALFQHRAKTASDGVAFTPASVYTIATYELGIDDASNALRRCIDDSSRTNPAQNRIISRTEFAVEEKHINAIPATVVTFYQANGEPLHLGLQLKGHKHYRDLDGFLTRARVQVEQEIATRRTSLQEGAS